MLWPLYRDGRTGLSFHWRLWTANIAKSSCHNSLFLEFRSSSSCPGGFLDWCSSADSLALQVFNSPSVQYSLSSFTKPSVFLFFFQMLCSIKLPFIFLGTPMPSLRAINDNNGFYSSLHSNYLPSLWLPLPLLLPTSGKDRPPPTDACRARWGGRTIGHDGAVRQRLKLTSLGPVESFRRQKKKLLDWQDLKLLSHLSLERFFVNFILFWSWSRCN